MNFLISSLHVPTSVRLPAPISGFEPESPGYLPGALPFALYRPVPAFRRDSGFYIPLHRAVQPSFILKEVVEPAPGSALDLNP